MLNTRWFDFLILTVREVSRALTLFNIVVDSCWPCFYPLSDKYMNMFLANANTGYNEVIYEFISYQSFRSHVA